MARELLELRAENERLRAAALPAIRWEVDSYGEENLFVGSLMLAGIMGEAGKEFAWTARPFEFEGWRELDCAPTRAAVEAAVWQALGVAR